MFSRKSFFPERMEGGSGEESWFSTLSPTGKAILISSGAIVAGGIAYFVFRQFYPADDWSLSQDYTPLQTYEDGYYRLIGERLSYVRHLVNPEYDIEKAKAELARIDRNANPQLYFLLSSDIALEYIRNGKQPEAAKIVQEHYKFLIELIGQDATDLTSQHFNAVGKCFMNILRTRDAMTPMPDIQPAALIEKRGFHVLKEEIQERSKILKEHGVIYISDPDEHERKRIQRVSQNIPRVPYVHAFMLAQLLSKKDFAGALEEAIRIEAYHSLTLPLDINRYSPDELEQTCALQSIIGGLYQQSGRKDMQLIYAKKVFPFVISPSNPMDAEEIIACTSNTLKMLLRDRDFDLARQWTEEELVYWEKRILNEPEHARGAFVLFGLGSVVRRYINLYRIPQVQKANEDMLRSVDTWIETLVSLAPYPQEASSLKEAARMPMTEKEEKEFWDKLDEREDMFGTF